MRLTLTLLALAVLTAPALAQAQPQVPPQVPPQTQPAAPAVPKAAAAPETAPDPTALHVTGLTQLNAGVVELALEGLAHPLWRCVGCELNQRDERVCAACKGEMIPIELTLLANVAVDVDAGTLRFEVLAGEQVRLSEIQAAVARFKVVIAPEQQFIPHACSLRVSGPASKEDVDALVASLRESKLFEKLTGSFDATGKQAELTVRCVGWPARPAVEEAIAKAAPDARLVDIVWSSGQSVIPGRN